MVLRALVCDQRLRRASKGDLISLATSADEANEKV